MPGSHANRLRTGTSPTSPRLLHLCNYFLPEGELSISTHPAPSPRGHGEDLR